MYNDKFQTSDELTYWQHKIFQRILKSIMVLGFIAYIPSVIISYKFKLWPVVLLDTFILSSLIGLFYLKNIEFGKRVFLFNLILYTLGIGLLLYLGPVGAGWIWLFTFPVLATLLSGFKGLRNSMLVNFFTLSALGIFLFLGYLDSFLISKYSVESWFIISINFYCINLLICYPVGIFVRQMKAALDQEKKTQQLLLSEREALAKNNADLIRTNNDLDNFIYTASHDLKAPISNIEGLINHLSFVLKDKTQEVEFILDLFFKSSERLNNTIKDLTEISKTHHNIEGNNTDTIQIREMISEIIQDLQASKFEICLDLKVEEITFSRKNLRSIYYNLISNSIKYASPTRVLVINIKTSWEEGYLLLEMSDNGLGMAEGYQDKIFKMFKRMHDHVEGSGLGLYILNRIVENNEGRIDVKSKLNEGTTFKVYLKALS